MWGKSGQRGIQTLLTGDFEAFRVPKGGKGTNERPV